MALISGLRGMVRDLEPDAREEFNIAAEDGYKGSFEEYIREHGVPTLSVSFESPVKLPGGALLRCAFIEQGSTEAASLKPGMQVIVEIDPGSFGGRDSRVISLRPV